jgi:hypothetical protein
MTYKKISDWTPVARLLASLTVSVLIIGFGAGGIYTAFANDIQSLKAKAEYNHVQIQNMQIAFQEFKTKQAVMHNTLNATAKQSETFQQATIRTLERILNKLDRAQP